MNRKAFTLIELLVIFGHTYDTLRNEILRIRKAINLKASS